MAAAAPAIKKEASHPATKVQYIDPRSPKFVIDETKNGRAEPYTRADLVDLINDIVARSKQGLPPIIQPVSTRPLDKDRVEVWAGFGRSIAARIINEEKLTASPVLVPYIVTRMNEYEGFLTNLSENLKRRNTTCVDDALNVRRLETVHGKSDEEILNIYSIDGKPRSRAWLFQTRKILKLEPQEQMELRHKRIAADLAYMIADIPEPVVRQQVMSDASAEAVAEAEAEVSQVVPVEEARAIIAEATGGKLLPAPQIEERVVKAAIKKGHTKATAKKVARAAKKIVQAKPEKKHVVKAIEKATGKDVRARKLTDVRSLFERLGGPGAGPRIQLSFCNLLADWIDGRNDVDTKKVEAAISRLFKMKK